MRLGIFLGIIAGLFTSACGFSSDEVRYRLTVEVETPEGLKTGSSVMGFKLARGFPQPYQSSFRGEAVAVDLGQRGQLFMLLGKTAMLPEYVFRRTGLLSGMPKEKRSNRMEILDFLADQVGVEADLQLSRPVEIQRFVRFRDINNPATVEEVDPQNLAVTYGKGVALRRISIEITDKYEPSGIEKHFIWWDEYHSGRKRLNGKTYKEISKRRQEVRLEHKENGKNKDYIPITEFSETLTTSEFKIGGRS